MKHLIALLVCLGFSLNLASGELVWITADSQATIDDVELMAALRNNPLVTASMASVTKPARYQTAQGAEVTGEPSLVIRLWSPGSAVPECVSDKITQVGETYLFKDSAGKAYLGGAGFYIVCANEHPKTVLIAGNSPEALKEAAMAYASSGDLYSSSDVRYYSKSSYLNTFYAILGNEYVGDEWINLNGGDTERAIFDGYGSQELAESLLNLAPGGTLVVMGDVDYYLSRAGLDKSAAYLLFDYLLGKSGRKLMKTHIYKCGGGSIERGTHLASDFPVFVEGANIMAGEYSCGSAAKSSLSNYGIKYENDNKVLIAGLSPESVKNIAEGKNIKGKQIPICSGNVCGNDCLCGGGALSCTGGLDADADGYYGSPADETAAKNYGIDVKHPGQYDCDDCPYDDVNVDIEYECPMNQSGLDCSTDSNNDGVPDYSACAHCKNPGMTEICDDVDNDCKGHCQSNPSQECSVVNYAGDGANGGCSGANQWDVADHFCQMVDDNVMVDNRECGGYNRCVKSAFVSETSQDYVTRRDYYFTPGGAGGRNADCGIEQSIRGTEWAETRWIASCLGTNEAVGRTRGTADLPNQYIDSLRGELYFKGFWPMVPQNKKNVIEWKISCVPKDKCSDNADNDGAEDIFDTVPYAYYVMEVDELTSAEGGGSVPVKNSFKMRFVDVDDPQCKLNTEFANLAGFPPPAQQPLSQDAGKNIYFKNPATGKPYCLDRDGDGFCGCLTEGKTCADKDNGGYSVPKQFMDCDDTIEAREYALTTTRSSLGWGQELQGKPYSAWNVHPFSPVGEDTCNLVYYDVNCNRGKSDGYDYSLLQKGGTPFDWDISTGKEYRLPEEGWTDQLRHAFEYPTDQDARCRYQSTFERRAGQVMTGVGIGALVIAGAGGGLALAGYGAVGSTLLISAGYIGAMVSAADAAVCLKAVTHGSDADWGVAKGSCIGVALDATLSGASYITGRIVKSRLVVSETRGITLPVQKSPNKPTGCFLAGTKITMADGSLANIEDIQVGDTVLAYDLASGSPVAAPVTATFVRKSTEYLKIEYEKI